MVESIQLQTSPLHAWVGFVAKDKEKDSIIIQVVIPELTPTATGTLSPASSNQSVQTKNLNGDIINTSVTTGNFITAYYIGNNSNRKYPPDVVRGEKVRITRISNSDKYYWESMGRDDALRSTEVHRVDVANRPPANTGTGTPTNSDNAPIALTDDTNTYSFELDTKTNKHIRLQTSKSNGEKFGYVIKLGGGDGTLQVADDSGNSFTIDSTNAKVIMRNSKDACLILNGEDIIIGAPRDILFKAGRQAIITSSLITVSANNVLSLIAKAISIAAKSALVAVAPAIGMVGAVQIPSTLVAGRIKSPPIVPGTPGAAYQSASIDTTTAVATLPNVTPNT